ncbi:hypothetical protein FH609_020025 [Streptomyces sp. 3MP-14]|uniref:Uncharacterized protein n=1 Tax=Streptomyces mimosae TaxID=2586635 RepID=A0A5N5ZQU4_9ACTN|nr:MULTISPECIES: hypothetical protein [Streptomyces]KAB8158881.1 hypothetical protein FH607_028675 [Streptomyces mimosae]KAB8174879.1 hypothetical protein FH609_020025 [Streptomyces sp. 3MP-14]
MNGPLMTLRTAVILSLGALGAAGTAVLTLAAGGSTPGALLAAWAAFGAVVPTLHRLIAGEASEAERA